MPNFHTQLGAPSHPGRQLPSRRHFEPGHNPYVTGHELPADSPLFFGRETILHSLRARLLSPAKPQSVSLLGERRIGKSSLLNQLVLSLANVPEVLVLQTCTQNWSHISTQDFFRELHLALCQGLGLPPPAVPLEGFEPVRDLIGELAHKHKYRFVLVLDEFERLAGNDRLGSNFFANLRTLGSDDRYRLGYVTASRRPLEELCRQHRIEESSFWNIFGLSQVLGLMADDEADALIQRPMREGLDQEIDPAQVFELAGNHPAFIQMVMFEAFEALQAERDPHWAEIRPGLIPYYRDLWDHRTPAEQGYLARLAAGEKIPTDSTSDDLRRRGLLTPKGAPFAPSFARFVQEQRVSNPENPPPQEKPMPPNPNYFSQAWQVLQSAIVAVPAVKYALGVAGMGAAASIGVLFLQNPANAFFSLLGMLFFMGLLFIFAGLAKTIPKWMQHTFLGFLLFLFIAISSTLFTSVFFRWPLDLASWLTGNP